MAASGAGGAGVVDVKGVFERIKARDPDQTEFLQTVHEVLFSLEPLFEKYPKLQATFERLAEPERVMQFRVPWLADDGSIVVNRGFRVQFNQAIGPYKGGLRFHPSVNLSIIKFLGFEQIFKNSLTTLALGGGKGGSDFNPKGKSDAEVMRFCQSFMTELSRHIGPDRDVPAGDIGVGGREIGYMYGQYKRLTAQFQGVLTGKGAEYGGSLLRPEATGYGAVYFAREMFAAKGETLEGKVALVSGSGNVAQFAVEKLLHCGAKPITLSDSGGYIVDPEGITEEKIKWVMELKNVRRGRISEYPAQFPSATYHAGKRPWAEKCDLAFPCATQNEVEKADAEALVAAGCKAVVEGANMPTDMEGFEVLTAAGVAFGPAKAANAGGVAVSGLEMAQNSQRQKWTAETVDEALQGIMRSIYTACADAAREVGREGDLATGANVAGFLKVANAMIAQGCV